MFVRLVYIWLFSVFEEQFHIGTPCLIVHFIAGVRTMPREWSESYGCVYFHSRIFISYYVLNYYSLYFRWIDIRKFQKEAVSFFQKVQVVETLHSGWKYGSRTVLDGGLTFWSMLLWGVKCVWSDFIILGFCAIQVNSFTDDRECFSEDSRQISASLFYFLFELREVSLCNWFADYKCTLAKDLMWVVC